MGELEIIPKRYKEYTPGTKCSVPTCDNPAEYEVYLYDFYPPPVNEEFLEQDFTCPFLCESHVEENEEQAQGERIPRGIVYYPYSNRNSAQGYTIYSPISEAYAHLFDGRDKLAVPAMRLEIIAVNDELVRYLARHPEMMYELEPRKFEELVAELFRDRGFDTTITPRTRDGGRDVLAVQNDDFGMLLYLIECKRYESTRKVGVEAVRGLYGVKMQERASVGILATTSSFTKDAKDFADPLKYELSLRDFEDLKKWLSTYGEGAE